ncbi:helix-turn-helix domain-containing protein [Rahnella bruchi]|jgi:DNA-binding HxlR family transcriptional regulator|uniref:winged helix-turn-helix transcriptional regulator n=1 Tax=Rahnella bruchi TaxID=1510573 RepID=UPI000E9FFA0F|nr:helix-turn-helix domain-containing protein [Rahnella bruchi]
MNEEVINETVINETVNACVLQEDTGFAYTLSLVSGKYKMVILYSLTGATPVVRFNELKRRLGKISFRTLSLTLKELESDGLIIRNEYPQIPPKVEYSLSARGQSLIPVLDMMCEWGTVHSNDPL